MFRVPTVRDSVSSAPKRCSQGCVHVAHIINLTVYLWVHGVFQSLPCNLLVVFYVFFRIIVLFMCVL
jgi:hypothetical protein